MKQDIVIVAHCTERFENVYTALLNNKMKVTHFGNTDDAKARLIVNSPAFVLLDYEIEGGDFFLKEIMNRYLWPRPFIIVSANFLDGKARAAMLRRGADACVDRPVIAGEVIAVIESVLRRGKQNAWNYRGVLESCIEYKELKIDPLRHQVTMRRKAVELTAKEFDVLYYLAGHCGMVLTKKEIFEAVWKNEYNPQSTNVSDQISSLRQKLGLSSKDTTYIQTVIGVGYRYGVLI